MIDIQVNGLLEVTRILCYQQSDFVFTCILLLSMYHVLTLLYVKQVRDYEVHGEMSNGSVVSRKHLVLVLWHGGILCSLNTKLPCHMFLSNFISFWCLVNNF